MQVLYNCFNFFVILLIKYTDSGGVQTRIVGGNDIDIAEAPYQASFQKNDKHFCGGVIYSPFTIITAGHCVLNIGNIREGYSVVVGITKQSETNVQRINIDKVITHPNYNPDTMNCDVAVLKLVGGINFVQGVQAIDLAKQPPAPGVEVFVTGWGAMKGFGKQQLSDHLKGVTIPVETKQFCQMEYYHSMPDTTFCAGDKFGGADACQGDSGGPALSNKELVGIVIAGRGCGLPVSAGWYTDITKVRNFLEQNKL